MKSHELAKLLLSLPDKEVYTSHSDWCFECNAESMPVVWSVDGARIVEHAPYPYDYGDIIILD